MLDMELDPTVVAEETAIAPSEADEPRGEDEPSDEELADEIIVEVSIDGMCGVY
jgi:mycofactocin precursor